MIIDLARRWINLHKRAMSISDCRSESFRSWKLKKMSIVYGLQNTYTLIHSIFITFKLIL